MYIVSYFYLLSVWYYILKIYIPNHISVKYTILYTLCMTKKQFVLDILEKITPIRALATELRKFVMLDILDNNAVNWIIDLLKEMAKKLENKTLQAHVIAIASKMEQMKTIELQEHIKDTKDIEKLLLSL